MSNPAPPVAPQRAAGLFFGLTSPAQRDDRDLFVVAVGEHFQGRLTLANYSLYDEFRVVCLVDYRQAPCDEEPLRPGLGQEASQPFALGPFPEGLHQVLFLAFFAPGNHTDEVTFRANSRYLFVQRRAWLQVGPTTTAVAQPPPARTYGQLSRDARRGFGLFQLVTGRRNLNFALPEWLVARSGPRVALDYSLLLTNPREEAAEYALLPFLDFRLFADPGDVSRVRVRAGSGAAIPQRLEATLAPGPHEWQVLAIQGPYLGPGERPGLQASAAGSARVLIQVED